MKSYYYFLILTICPFLSLGWLVLDIGGLPLVGVGTFFELFAITTIAFNLFGSNRKYLHSNQIPLRKNLMLFCIFYIAYLLRNVILSDSFSEAFSYLRILPYIFVYNVVVSAPYPNLAIKSIYKLILRISLVISIAIIIVGVTNIPLPGLNHEQYTRLGRIIWGYPTTVLLGGILTSYKLFHSQALNSLIQTKLIMLLVLFGLALLLTQSRFLLVAFVLSLASAIWQKKGNRTYRVVSLVFFLIVLLSFLSLRNISGGFLERFEEFTNETSLAFENIRLNESNNLGRFGPLISGLNSNKGLDIFVGQGRHTGFLETSNHLHSGLGYVYATSGLLGVFIVYGLLFKIVNFYSKSIQYMNEGSFEAYIVKGLIYMLKVLIVSSIVIGHLLQGSYILWGILVGSLELCRRSTRLTTPNHIE